MLNQIIEDMKKVIATPDAPKAVGPYSQAIEVNGTLYISGQIPVNPADGKVQEDIVAAAHQSLKNIGAILKEAGMTYDNVVKDLASTGAEGIVQLAGMLVPADQGKNATLEYALYAVVSYVTGPDKDAERAEVRKGLMQAIDKCTDKANKAFLMNK